MVKNLQDAVVVITGASSGIGRAAALEFARKGSHVVLAARRENLLQDVASEVRRVSGKEALVVPTDVRDEQAVKELARQTRERFGHIDVWINNAGVGAYGRFEEMPADVYRQVIETDLFGTTYGARAVLPYFREQGSGVLINTSSLVGAIPVPYASPYAAAKFGIRALGASLRQELEALDKTDIHICTVMPATIDTPFFRHVANYSGRVVRALPPVYMAEQVAKTMVKCAQRPQREVFVGNAGRMMSMMYNAAPLLMERVLAYQINAGHFKPEPAPPAEGNVLRPMQEGRGISDGWGGAEKTRARLIVTASVATLALGAVTWAWLRNRE